MELKHASAYLPYGVQIEVTDICIDLMGGETKEETYITTLDTRELDYFKEDMKLILHPLSDLTKEIEHNGKKFVPTKALSIWDLQGITVIDIPHIPVNLYELLLKWHFDVFGLIEQNLAININTL